MTTPQPKTGLTNPQRPGEIQKIASNFRLKFRLARDSRVPFLTRAGFFVGILWVLFPDMVPGLLDDGLVLAFLINFESFCPNWVVADIKNRLAAEGRRQERPTPTAQSSTPTPITPTPPEPNRLKIVIVRSDQNTIYHLTRRAAETIKNNPPLMKSLSRLGAEWDHDNFLINSDQEGEVFKALAKYLPSFQIIIG